MSTSLTTLDFINGLFSLLVISVTTIVGILITFKYLKYKKKIFFYWGLYYIGAYCPWWSSAFSFVSYWFTGNSLPLAVYIGIGILISPIIIILWILGLTEMIYERKRIILILIYSIISVIFELYCIYFLIINPEVLGVKERIFDIKYSLIVTVYFIWLSLTIVITGLLFAKESFKSEDREVRFKGKALIIAFLTYPICGLLDSAFNLNEIGLILVRSILMFGAFMFYIGFFVPKFIKNIFHL